MKIFAFSSQAWLPPHHHPSRPSSAPCHSPIPSACTNLRTLQSRVPRSSPHLHLSNSTRGPRLSSTRSGSRRRSGRGSSKNSQTKPLPHSSTLT